MSPATPAAWPVPTPVACAPADASAPVDLSQLFPSSIRWAADYAQAVADEIQVDPLLVAPSMLAVASIAATGACIFDAGEGFTVVPTIWSLTVAPPSERKSPTLKKVQEPLMTIGAETTSVPDADNGLDNEPADESEGEDEDEDEGGEEADQPCSATGLRYRPAQVLAMDISKPALFDHARQHDGRLAFISDEDRIIGPMAASKGNGLDLFLKGYDGSPVSRRNMTGAIEVPHLHTVVSLMAQPAVAQMALTNKTLCGRGFSQRFLYIQAARRQNVSFFSRRQAPAEVVAAWHAGIERIAMLPRSQTGRSITMEPEAMQALGQLHDRYRSSIETGEWTPFVTEWMGKAHGQALRIAGLFALLRSAEATTITLADMQAAERWVDLSLSHLTALVRQFGETDPVVAQAKRVLRWLAQGNGDRVAANTITQALRGAAFATVEQWKPVFDLLTANGWLRPSLVKPTGKQGGRPSLTYEVNPALLIGAAA